MNKLQGIINVWAKWESKQFPHATTLSRIKHLKKEVIEIEEDPHNLEEYVDALALLLLAARGEGINVPLLENGLLRKLEINKKRLWGEINSEGFVEHIR